MAGTRRGKGGRRAGRRSGHADISVAPELSGDPVQRVEPVGRVVGVDAIDAFRSVTPARVLINRGIAPLHDGPPAAQDRPPHRRIGIRQPAKGRVVNRIALRFRNAIGRALQDDRKGGAARFRQIDEGVEPDPIAHRDKGLETPGHRHVATKGSWPRASSVPGNRSRLEKRAGRGFRSKISRMAVSSHASFKCASRRSNSASSA